MFPQGVRGQGRSELAVATIFPLTCTPSLWAARTIRRGHWMSSHEARDNGLARGAHRPRGTQGGRGNSAARLGAGGEAVLVAGGGGACGPGGVGAVRRPCLGKSGLGPVLSMSRPTGRFACPRPFIPPRRGKRGTRYSSSCRNTTLEAPDASYIRRASTGAPKSHSEGTAASTAASAQGWDRLGR